MGLKYINLTQIKMVISRLRNKKIFEISFVNTEQKDAEH